MFITALIQHKVHFLNERNELFLDSSHYYRVGVHRQQGSMMPTDSLVRDMNTQVLSEDSYTPHKYASL